MKTFADRKSTKFMNHLPLYGIRVVFKISNVKVSLLTVFKICLITQKGVERGFQYENDRLSIDNCIRLTIHVIRRKTESTSI